MTSEFSVHIMMQQRLLRRMAATCFVLGVALVGVLGLDRKSASKEPPVSAEIDRSPVDLVLTADEKRLITVNQSSNTVSLVDVESGRVLSEAGCDERPSALAIAPNQKIVLVTATFGGTLHEFRLEDDRLVPGRRLDLGYEPRGVAITPDGKTAVVALTTGNQVAVVDLAAWKVESRIDVGSWPRYLALSPDGKRLAVGVNGDGGVAVVEMTTRKLAFTESFLGMNLGQMHASKDGKRVYFPWIVYRQNPISSNNIRQGWVLASRIARVRFDEKSRREAISLDPRGQAVADPHGLALSPDENWIVCAASGTHELLVYRREGLPFQDYGGPGDHIDSELLGDRDRYYRIELGGRPMTVRFAADGRRVFVANSLLNCVQIVEISTRTVERSISLGGPKTPSLARRGEAIFTDGRRSLDQWYSCHSCHYEGHTNALTMDTRNDGRSGNYKTVLSLRNVTHTGPWFWHGWQKDLHAGVRKSMLDTMEGQEPTAADVDAVIAYFGTLKSPPNPNRPRSGGLSEAAKRGEKVFRGSVARCSSCHTGEYFADGRVHNVGTGVPGDAYEGFSTPSLRGIYDRTKYLHDGRAASLEEVVKKFHNPAKVSGEGELSDAEIQDLLAFLREI